MSTVNWVFNHLGSSVTTSICDLSSSFFLQKSTKTTKKRKETIKLIEKITKVKALQSSWLLTNSAALEQHV